MLATILPLLRTVVMALTTAVPVTVAQQFFDGTVIKITEVIKDEHGLTLSEAKDIVANLLFDLALNATIVGTVLKTKIAVKTAEYLGFTSKGYVKRTLSPKAAAAIKKMSGPWEKFKSFSLFSKILTIIGVGNLAIWQAKSLADIIEPGVYQTKQVNAVYRKLGIPFQYPETAAVLSPGNFSAEKFNDFARSIEAAGVFGFRGVIGSTLGLYSRQGLADVIDYVYGNEILKGTTFNDYRGVIPFVTPYLVSNKATSATSSTQANTSSASQVVPQTKVFTGIVSQGTVGSGLQFTARPDDLIESASELQQAINNNVSSYLATLLGKVTYEIKVVSSVIVGGIRKTGTSQRIQSGSFANGTPKYKSVTNKFAVADLYLITDRGTRSKLTSIVLGPVDALKFQPTSDDLVGVASSVSRNILTSNTDEIDKIVTSTPTLVVPPASAEDSIEAPGVGYCVVYDGYQGTICFNKETVSKLRLAVAKNEKTLDQAENELRLSIDMGGQDTWANNGAKNLGPLWQLASPKVRSILSTGGTFAGTPQQTQAGVSPPVTAPFKDNQTPANALPVQSLPEVALTAPNLYEFYGALGRQLPTLTERGDLYQSLGLGQAAFYTGTAEQNTKLLATLKLKGV